MLKVAVVGTGFIGSVHARNIALHPGAELVAVSEANLESAKRVAAPVGAEVVADVREIFDRQEIEAVLIASPTNTNIDYLQQAAQVGKAVYFENPIGVDYQESV